MMKMIGAVLCVGIACTLSAAPFYLAGPRNQINLAGEQWERTNADTVLLDKVPSGAKWEKTVVPYGKTGLKSANNTPYFVRDPKKVFFEADGKTFKQKTDLSCFLRRTVIVPADALKDHSVFLAIGNAAFKSAVWVNGKKVYESIQACLPHDVNITDSVKSGKNEIVIAVTSREALVDPVINGYLAPNSGVGIGISRYVRLEFRPQVAVEDVFVKTSVKQKKIDFELTLANRGRKEISVVPQIAVSSRFDSKSVLKTLEGSTVKLLPGETKTVNVGADWRPAVLWSPETPMLYDADIRLVSGDTLVDSMKQRFGFREFEIRGRDFFLNGRRVTLLRGSTLTSAGHPELFPRWGEKGKLNTMRLHLGFNNEQYIRMGDEEGYMVIPEAALWVEWAFPTHAKNVWMPAMKEYYKGWIRTLRNHPSIVMWSLANEYFWGRRTPGDMEVAGEIVRTVYEMDRTRPLQGDAETDWNKQLPVINIHYPEEFAGEINKGYVNSGLNMPNDARHLKKDAKNIAQFADFNWDNRPLVIGEYFANSRSQRGDYSSFMGDSIFDGEKWRKQDLNGLGVQNSEDFMDNLFVETLKKYTVEYRRIGVAGLNIWTGEKASYMPEYQVRPADFHPNGDAGQVFRRKIAIFNDGKSRLRVLSAALTCNGAILWEKESKFNLYPGSRKEMTLEFPLPRTANNLETELLVRLFIQDNDAYAPYEVSRYSEKIYAVPEKNLSLLKHKVAVPGISSDLRSALKHFRLEDAPGAITTETKLVVVGANSLNKELIPVLEKFAENGGTVFFLPQKEWVPFRSELPDRDKNHAATQAWLRIPEHPLLKGMKEGQFSFWKPDNVVSRETFRKPFEGAFEVPLDCGGRYGLSWTPLALFPIGKGMAVVTSFDLEKASMEDPGARLLFANILEYGAERKPSENSRLNVVAGENGPLFEALDLVRADYASGIGQSGPVLVDASAGLKPSIVAGLKDALNNGRTVWLHGFSPDTLGNVASLFPFKPELSKVSPGVNGAVVRSQDPLIRGVANFDLFWYRGATGSHGQIVEKVIAKTGDWVANLPWMDSVERLTSPAFLTRINSGKGTILLDTLQWEKATSLETEKSLRLLSILIRNSGGGFKTKSDVRYKKFFVNLKPFANMGYHDRVADDGKGGWTDQGNNDMRFFLINHTGKGGGADDGMEVPVPPFPTDVMFNKISYRLLNPKANDGKAVISLGSSEHGVKLPKETAAIPVNEKADILWFLHSAGWAGPKVGTPIAEYDVLYGDDSTVKIPIRFGMEVGDWHSPNSLGSASVAWTGRNLFTSPVGIWSFAWKNPHPEKMIKSVKLKGNLSSAQYVLMGISGGVREDGAESVVAEWNFADRKYPSVLRASKEAPAPVADGVKFEHGTTYYGNTKNSNLIDAMKKPFSILVDFTPTAKPDGYLGGLFQCFSYMNSGLRLYLGQDMKFGAEIYIDKKKPLHLSGKMPLEFGKRYVWEIRFDGKKVILLQNGKIDSVKESPLPRPFSGDILFGNTGGDKYYFNGVIHRVVWKSL